MYNSKTTITTVFCLKVLLLEKHWYVRSARPDLHVFYSDGKSGKNLDSQCMESSGFLRPVFWVDTWRSGLADLYYKLFVLFCFVYDYGLWSEDPSRDCLMAPNQSGPTSIGLTSGRVIPLKNLPYSCKYSAGETLKVWFARGAIAIAR